MAVFIMPDFVKKCAVFGNPVNHSLSPQLHQLFSERTGIAIDYDKHAIESSEFESRVDDFFASSGSGLNITIPFKQRAFRHCRKPTKRAVIAQAVNTLWYSQGQLHGDNTDGIGLVTDLEKRLGWSIEATRVLIFGAGGSVRGVLPSLLNRNPARLTIANRTKLRAQELVKLFGEDYPLIDLQACEFDQCGKDHDYVINATSISLGDQQIPFLPETITAQTACYDLAYCLERPTKFCHWAQDIGCTSVSDGLGMLVEQGAESFRLWHGEFPNTSGIVAQLRGVTNTG